MAVTLVSPTKKTGLAHMNLRVFKDTADHPHAASEEPTADRMSMEQTGWEQKWRTAQTPSPSPVPISGWS